MTGIPNLNFPKFDKIKRRLERHGFDVISPADLDRSRDSSMSYENRMRDDLKHLIDPSMEFIFMMDGWQRSKGALTEYVVAKAIGLGVIYECF